MDKQTRLVPIDPTEEMLIVGARSLINCGKRGGTSWADEAKLVYKGMLAAAPEQPSRKVYQCPRCATSMEVDESAKPSQQSSRDAVLEALKESVKLQSHYAALLNQYDGGNRKGFCDAQEWLDRLRALKAQSAETAAATNAAGQEAPDKAESGQVGRQSNAEPPVPAAPAADEPNSRSQLRRVAAMKGETTPTFDAPAADEPVALSNPMTTTVAPNSQRWSGMSGDIAYHLIERHADNWADVRMMMEEWLNANTRPADVKEGE